MKKSLLLMFAVTLSVLSIAVGVFIGRNTFGNVISIDIVGNNDGEIGKININTATMEQLMMLPGVGQTKAQSILEYREENGFFETVDDLAKVSGFSTQSVEALRKYITVGG